jgi:hypothetical protein
MVSVLRRAAELLSRIVQRDEPQQTSSPQASLADHFERRPTVRHVLKETESRTMANVVLALEGATALLGVGRAQAGIRPISRDFSAALETAESATVSPEARDAARRVLWKTYVESSAPAPLSTETPSPAVSPAPASIPGTAATFAEEKAWAEAHGVSIPAGKVTVVAKRRGDSITTKFQDEIVVFTKGGSIERFAGTTRPSQLVNPDGKLVPDVDGDGKKDLGTPRPGHYRASGPWSWGVLGKSAPAFRLLDHGRDSLPAWRDLDGDGAFSDEEKAKSEARGYRIGAVRIHYGFDADGNIVDGTLYSGPVSVGCQNIQLSDLPRFLQAVGGTSATFDYAIVEDSD